MSQKSRDAEAVDSGDDQESESDVVDKEDDQKCEKDVVYRKDDDQEPEAADADEEKSDAEGDAITTGKEEQKGKGDIQADNDETKKVAEGVKKRPKKEKKVSLPIVSLSDAEYDEIFDAVMARMETELQASEEAAAAVAADLTLFDEDIIKEDDFDAILQESDKNIGKYVEAFLDEGADKLADDDEDGVLTSTPILEQIVHSSQETKDKVVRKPEVFKAKPKKQDNEGKSEPKTKVKKNPSSEKHERNLLSKTTHRIQVVKSEKISKKLQMQKRKIEEKGTWVQCETCEKWRYLAEVYDPALLPAKWMCLMNTDSDRTNCDAEEEDWNKEEHTDEYVLTKYTEGSVVWARMNGFPWWPAMIEMDPDTNAYCECNVSMEREHGKTNVATHYHVVFLDDKVSRAWVRSSFVHVFTGMEDMGTFKAHGVNYKKQIQLSVEKALTSLELSLEERIKTYGFAARYNGKWASGAGSQNEKKEKRKKKRKRIASTSPDADLSILQDAEELLRNTETVLDELLSLSESEEADSEASLPLKKRKIQREKKTKEKETPVKKPTFVSQKKAATSKKPASKPEKTPDAENEKSDAPKKRKKTSNNDTVEKIVPSIPKAIKQGEKLEKVVKSTDKPTPKKTAKKGKKETPLKAKNEMSEKEKNVMKPVFSLPKGSKVVKKDKMVEENPADEGGTTEKMDKDGEEKNKHEDSGAIDQEDTDAVDSADKNPASFSETKEKVTDDAEKTSDAKTENTKTKKATEKPKPAFKAKKSFMAPVVRKDDAGKVEKQTRNTVTAAGKGGDVLKIMENSSTVKESESDITARRGEEKDSDDDMDMNTASPQERDNEKDDAAKSDDERLDWLSRNKKVDETGDGAECDRVKHIGKKTDEVNALTPAVRNADDSDFDFEE